MSHFVMRAEGDDAAVDVAKADMLRIDQTWNGAESLFRVVAVWFKEDEDRVITLSPRLPIAAARSFLQSTIRNVNATKGALR